MSDAITIPGYTIEGQLGQGGMASVYLAIQESFGRKVALKVMSPAFNSDPSFAERFMREARIVAGLSHASIVPVFDVGEHASTHYLSMEYLPAGDLRTRIATGESSVELATDVCMSVCAALEVAHRKGFVHRDIKPENILFREDGTPVVTDFGIARAVDSGQALTMAGMLVGTPNYMSPEQVKGEDLDGRSDLYAVGVVFYEILTGSVPFRADSSLSVALKHVSDPLPPLPAALADYQEFIDQLMAKDRETRYATGADVIRALREISTRRGLIDPTLVRRPLPPVVSAKPAEKGKSGRSKPKEARSSKKVASRKDAPRKEASKKEKPAAAPPVVRPVAPPPAPARRGRGFLWVAALAVLAAGGGGLWALKQQGRFPTDTVTAVVSRFMAASGVRSSSSASSSAASGRLRRTHRVAAADPPHEREPPQMEVASAPAESKPPQAVPDAAVPAAPESATSSASTSSDAGAGPAPGAEPAVPTQAGEDVPPQADQVIPAPVPVPPSSFPKVKTPAVRTAAVPPPAPHPPLSAKDKRLEDERRERQEKQEREIRARTAQLNAQTAAAQIKDHLAAAARSLESGALWQPAGSSAADHYHAVLQLQKTQAAALAGARRLAGVLVQEAQRSEAAGDIYTSRLLIEQVRQLQPGNPRLRDLQATLTQMQAKPPELDAHAKELLHTAATLIARSHESLTRNPSDPKAAEDATEAYDGALAAAPNAPGLPSLQVQLIAVYPGAVRAALSRKDIPEARKLIAAAHKDGLTSGELNKIAAALPKSTPAPRAKPHTT